MPKAAYFFLSLVLSAAAQPNLAGIWEDKSQNIVVKIEQQGPTHDITVRSAGSDLHYKTVIGKETSQQEIRGVSITTTGEIDGHTLVTRLWSHVQEQQELSVVSRMTVSDDGNTIIHVQTRRQGNAPETTDTRTLTRLPSTGWSPEPPVVFAEAVYKNIQIMKGVPAPKLIDTMQKLTRWLGVECSHCHVPQHAELDEKPAKQTARKMFLMVGALNHDSFPETNAVTCWTCHRGSAKPDSLPPK